MVTTGIANSGYTNSVEIVDLLSTSTPCQNFPSFPTWGSNGELDKNGNPMVCGGYFGGSSSQCETFVDGSWRSSPPLTESRYYSSMIKSPFLNDSISLFATGSWNPDLNSAEI